MVQSVILMVNLSQTSKIKSKWRFVLWFHHLEWVKSPPNSDLKSPVMTHVIPEKKLEPKQLGVVAKPPRRSRPLRDMLQKAIIYLLGLKHVTSNKSIQVCFIETHPKSSTCGLKLVDWNVSWNLSTFFFNSFCISVIHFPRFPWFQNPP